MGFISFKNWLSEATIGDFFKNQVELVINNDTVDKQLFIDCKNSGKKVLADKLIVSKCKNYIKTSFSSMGYKKLTDETIQLKFYDSEKIIVGIIPDGIFKVFGKTGQSVSMRKINIIVIEKSQLENDREGWLEHEVGHIISYRDHKDSPKIKNQFISGDKLGAEDNIFNPKDCFGENSYPNVWYEYIPFSRQIKYLLKSNKADVVIRLLMKDYEAASHHGQEDLKKYEQIFINYINAVLNKDSGIKNKYAEKKAVSESIDFTRGGDPMTSLGMGISSLRPYPTISFYEYVENFKPRFGKKILNTAAELLKKPPIQIRALVGFGDPRETNSMGEDLIPPGPAELFYTVKHNDFLRDHNFPEDKIIQKIKIDSKIELELSEYNIVYVFFPYEREKNSMVLQYILGI